MVLTITSRAVSDASVEEVWELLRDPERWPEFEALSGAVEGASTPLEAGHRLHVVGAFVPLRVAVEVRVVHPLRRLGVSVRRLPGMIENVDVLLLPLPRGRTDIEMRSLLRGPSAPLVWPTVRASSPLTTRRLAALAARSSAT